MVFGIVVTKGGQIKVNIWNSRDDAVQLNSKIVHVKIFGADVSFVYFGKKEKTKMLKFPIMRTSWRPLFGT